MSDYTRITDRKIELTDEGVKELMTDYTPQHEGDCCLSCEQDQEYGFYFEAECCCKAVKDKEKVSE